MRKATLYAQMVVAAKRVGVDISKVPKTPLREIDAPSHSSCRLPDNRRCADGWHWRQIRPAGRYFVYDENDKDSGNLDCLTYDGKQVAYERCPAYWKNRRVDPKNPLRLLPEGDEKRKARRSIAE